MTEKWVSQPKHWCKICKVWCDAKIISVRFHEQGARHKEMQALHLDEQRKRRANSSMSAKEMDAEMKAIEEVCGCLYVGLVD